MRRRRVLILGAAGRDFHNFNVLFRDREEFEVVGFTATQIPDIAGAPTRRSSRARATRRASRSSPRTSSSTSCRTSRSTGLVLATPTSRTRRHAPGVAVDRRGGRLRARRGAAGRCSLGRSRSSRSPRCAPASARARRRATSRRSSRRWARRSSPSATRCPTATSSEQVCQRFATYADLDKHKCTIEEREEYEPHIDNGFVVYAGVDYGRSCARPRRRPTSSSGTAATTTCRSTRPTSTSAGRPASARATRRRYHPGEANVPLRRPHPRQQVRHRPTGEGHRVDRGERCRRLNPTRHDPPRELARDPRRSGGGPRQAGARRRGRPDAHPRRDDLRRRRRRRAATTARPRSSTRRRTPSAPSRRPTRSTRTRGASCRRWATATSRSATSRRRSETTPCRPRRRRDADRPHARPQDRQADRQRQLRARRA